MRTPSSITPRRANALTRQTCSSVHAFMHKRSCLLVGTDAPLAGPEFHPRSENPQSNRCELGQFRRPRHFLAYPAVEAVYSACLTWPPPPARASQFLPARNCVEQNSSEQFLVHAPTWNLAHQVVTLNPVVERNSPAQTISPRSPCNR